MTGRLPIVATALVAVAVAIMVGLGIWQIQRAQWKDRLVERYSAAPKLPPIAFPTAPSSGEPPLFRWATGYCLRPLSRRATAGANRRGESGYAHIVHCATGAEGPGMAVELGWSKDPQVPISWSGGAVSGTVAPDSKYRMRLVADDAPPGLRPSAVPTIDSIPNNHLLYAIQWFLFAVIAVVIYLLAVRKRLAGDEGGPAQ